MTCGVGLGGFLRLGELGRVVVPLSFLVLVLVMLCGNSGDCGESLCGWLCVFVFFVCLLKLVLACAR